MSSRQYIKRVWRVPKTSPPAYLGALVVKKMVKHGWPAKLARVNHDSFVVHHYERGAHLPPDFSEALEIAIRILARTYRVEVDYIDCVVTFRRDYILTAGGFFKENRS